MKNLVVVLGFALIISCQTSDKKEKQTNTQVLEIDSISQTDTLIFGKRIASSYEYDNQIEYSFVINKDTLEPKFMVKGNESYGYQIRHYPVSRDRFIWLQKLAEHLAFKNIMVNSISMGKLVSQPFANEITTVYRAKHGKDVAPDYYESLERIIMQSELVATLNHAIKPMGVTVKEVDVEKVFYTKNNGVEVLNCMVWARLEEID